MSVDVKLVLFFILFFVLIGTARSSCLNYFLIICQTPSGSICRDFLLLIWSADMEKLQELNKPLSPIL